MLRSFSRTGSALASSSLKSMSSSSFSSPVFSTAVRSFAAKPSKVEITADETEIPTPGALEKPAPIPVDVAINYQQLESIRQFYKNIWPLPESMWRVEPDIQTPNKFIQAMRHYGGVYSCLGLGIFFLIQKEYMHILDDHMSLLFLFVGIMQGAYIYALPELRKAVWAAHGEIMKRQNGIFDLAAEVLKREIRQTEFEINLGKMYREYRDELNALVKTVGTADVLKAKAALYQETISALKSIQQREQGEKAVFAQAVYEKTSAHVLKAFIALPKEEKDILVDYAISVLGGNKQPLDSKTDPVKKLYRDYLNNKGYLKEIDADKAKSKK